MNQGSLEPVCKASIAKSFLGHKGRAFDVRFDMAGQKLITASEDGTCKVWDYSNSRCLKTIIHNKEAEVLRATFLDNIGICTSGSDGNAVLWSVEDCRDPTAKVEKAHVFEHGEEAQIYVCETINTDLLIAADNFMVLWDLTTLQQRRKYEFFDNADPSDPERPSFGGHRNPDNDVYVFDAKINPANSDIISVALSDSTTRVLDTRTPGSEAIASVSLARLFAGSSEKIGHATSVRCQIFKCLACA
jgi:WD40 repeat protein